MTVLVAVFRRPEMLTALLCERRDENAREHENPGVPYAERMVPLSAIPEEMCSWRDADIRAWRSLGKVPSMSRKAARAIVRVLLSTVVSPELAAPTDCDFSFEKGAVDLRPLLCNPAGEKHLLGQLGDAVPGSDSSDLPSWHWSHRDEIAALPERFRRHFLWGLSLAPWSHVELMLAVFQTLKLGTHPATSLAVARLAIVGSREATLWWCDVLAEVPEPLRAAAIEQVLMAGAQASMPDAESRAALAAGDLQGAATALGTLSGS